MPFLNLKSYSFFLFRLIFFLFFSCTAVSIRNWPLSFAPNTHPMPEYAELSILLKGGVVYTNESRVSFINSTTKLLRKGKACVHSALYLIAWGDASIEAARVNGAVAHVNFLEQEILAILGFVYHRHCTIVMGE